MFTPYTIDTLAHYCSNNRYAQVFRALTILLKGGTTLFSIQLIVIIQTYISWSNISNKNKTTLNSKLNVTTLEYGKQKLLKPSTFS